MSFAVYTRALLEVCVLPTMKRRIPRCKPRSLEPAARICEEQLLLKTHGTERSAESLGLRRRVGSPPHLVACRSEHGLSHSSGPKRATASSSRTRHTMAAKVRCMQCSLVSLGCRAPPQRSMRACVLAPPRPSTSSDEACMHGTGLPLCHPQGERAEVTLDDQVRINTFSRLNARMHDLMAQVKAKKVRGQCRPMLDERMRDRSRAEIRARCRNTWRISRTLGTS